MERDHGSLAEGVGSFHTTRWTIVMRAAQRRGPWGQFALAGLCRTVSDPAEIDEEMHALCDPLIATEGRLGP